MITVFIAGMIVFFGGAILPLLIVPSIVAVVRSRLRMLTSLSDRELHQSAPFSAAVHAYT